MIMEEIVERDLIKYFGKNWKSLPFKIQCKNSKRPKFLDAVREANTDKEKSEMGLGVVKVTNKGEYAIMEWEDFLRLLRLCFIHV